MILEMTLLLALLLIFVLSSLPLYITVKLLGGKGGILRVIFVNIFVALLAYGIKIIFDSWSGLIAFVAMVWVYRESFRLKWWKAFFAWFIQIIVAALLIILFGALGLMSLGLLIG